MSTVLFQGPQGMVSSKRAQVLVNGEELFLYETRVYYPPYYEVKKVPFGYFDSWEKVRVEVRFPNPVEKVIVRPLKKEIRPEKHDGGIFFEMGPGDKISIEPDGDLDRTLLLFCNLPEQEPIQGQDVISFGPGVHEAGVISLKSGQTLYLAGGAYVHAKVVAKDAERIRICGRGILSGEIYQDRNVGVLLEGCSNSSVEGVILLDPPNWTLKINGCDQVTVDNVKIIGWRGNSDGIDVCGSRDISVTNCFVRGFDDSLTVKAFGTGDVRNIRFAHCALWCDMARTIEIGYENQADWMTDIVFEDIDIIHALSGYPVLGVHEGDRAVIENVLFRDIRIEDVPGVQLFDLRIKPSAWNADSRTGKISHVKFANISLIGKPGITMLPAQSRIEGYHEESTISDIVFEDIELLGKQVRTMDEMDFFIGKYCSDIHVKQTKTFVPEQNISVVKSSINAKCIGNDHAGQKKYQLTVKLENQGHAETAEKAWISIQPTGQNLEFQYQLQPGQTQEASFQISLQPGKYYAGVQGEEIGLFHSWTLIEATGDLKTSLPEDGGENLPWYPIRAVDGFELGQIAWGRTQKSLNAYVRIQDHFDSSGNHCGERNFCTQNTPKGEHAIYLYIAEPEKRELGEAVFLLPETLSGLCPAIVQGENGPELAPEIRNYQEITFTFKNQPKIKRGAEIKLVPFAKEASIRKFGDLGKTQIFSGVQTTKTQQGYEMTVSIPFEELFVSQGAKQYLMEVLAEVQIPDKDDYITGTVFHSLAPSECAHMYGKFICQESEEE